MEQDLEITKIEELDRNTLYHVNLPEGTNPAVVKSFAQAASKLDLKLFITIGAVVVERMCDVFAQLPDEQKVVIRNLLEPQQRVKIGEIVYEDGEACPLNPIAHEQTK